MPIIPSNGKWYRVTAEEVYTLQLDPNAASIPGITPDEQIPKVFRSALYYLGSWEEIGGTGVVLLKQEHGRDRDAIDEAIKAVLNIGK